MFLLILQTRLILHKFKAPLLHINIYFAYSRHSTGIRNIHALFHGLCAHPEFFIGGGRGEG